MILTCPHCQKTISVSQEEIALRGGNVVCPQCLGSYHIHTDLTAEQVLAARGVVHPHCPECDRELPPQSGISFCPYCGASLSPSRHEPEPQKTEPVREKPTEHKPRHRHTHHTPEQKWTPMIPTYYHNQNDQTKPAGALFQILAWLIILALTAVLVYVIYHALKLL